MYPVAFLHVQFYDFARYVGTDFHFYYRLHFPLARMASTMVLRTGFAASTIMEISRLGMAISRMMSATTLPMIIQIIFLFFFRAINLDFRFNFQLSTFN